MALLQLHRLYWIAHVRDNEPIVQRGYLPSAFATFGSACMLIKAVQDIWICEPEISARGKYLFGFTRILSFADCTCFTQWGKSHDLCMARC